MPLPELVVELTVFPVIVLLVIVDEPLKIKMPPALLLPVLTAVLPLIVLLTTVRFPPCDAMPPPLLEAL